MENKENLSEAVDIQVFYNFCEFWKVLADEDKKLSENLSKYTNIFEEQGDILNSLYAFCEELENHLNQYDGVDELKDAIDEFKKNDVSAVLTQLIKAIQNSNNTNPIIEALGKNTDVLDLNTLEETIEQSDLVQTIKALLEDIKQKIENTKEFLSSDSPSEAPSKFRQHIKNFAFLLIGVALGYAGKKEINYNESTFNEPNFHDPKPIDLQNNETYHLSNKPILSFLREKGFDVKSINEDFATVLIKKGQSLTFIKKAINSNDSQAIRNLNKELPPHADKLYNIPLSEIKR